jgi:hypothetical protein
MPRPVAFGPGIEENGHMKNRMAPWLMFLAVAYCPVARTQAQQSVAKQAPTAVERDNREKNFKEYIELLRADVRHQKAEIMGAMMALNAADAAKFWPIYSEYDSALNKLNDLRVANIKDYAQNYNNMTDAKADELIQNAMSYRKERSELLANYYGRVKGALGAIQAARFVQIEDQLLLLIDLQVAASLPVAGQGS